MVLQHRLSHSANIVAGCIISAAWIIVPGCGGDNGSDGASGGQSAATGGASSTTGGKQASSGGASSTTGGEATSSGGSASITGGSASVTGGSASVTGGSASVTGGSASVTGGSASVTGGAPSATGGTATGGTATGGTATGGTATGGTATGGTPTGGTATGGTNNCIPAATPGPSGMNPGQACLGCHASAVQPNFKLAGTLYDTVSGTNAVSGATVTVTDSNSAVTTLVSGTSGNFYSNAAFAFPVSVSVSKCPDTVSMSSKPSTGDCNSCHGTSFRIHLP